MNVARLLLHSAQLWGDNPALIDPARKRTMTFSELAAATFSFGQNLRQHGLAAGDRVAILGDATPEYLLADHQRPVDYQIPLPRAEPIQHRTSLYVLAPRGRYRSRDKPVR